MKIVPTPPPIAYPVSKSFDDKINELPTLMVDQAYRLLRSGEKLTASDLKVCLDITKTYGVEIQKAPENILTDTLPFNED